MAGREKMKAMNLKIRVVSEEFSNAFPRLKDRKAL
jgi:hypothetical protein